MGKHTRDELDALVEDLGQQLPDLIDSGRPDLMDAFSERADAILALADPADRDHVWSKLQCLLRDAGLIPGDEEPCSD